MLHTCSKAGASCLGKLVRPMRFAFALSGNLGDQFDYSLDVFGRNVILHCVKNILSDAKNPRDRFLDTAEDVLLVRRVVELGRMIQNWWLFMQRLRSQP